MHRVESGEYTAVTIGSLVASPHQHRRLLYLAPPVLCNPPLLHPATSTINTDVRSSDVLSGRFEKYFCRKLLILVGRYLEFMWFLFVYFTCSMSIHFLNLNVHKSQQGRGSLNSQIEKFDVQTTEPITVSALSRLTRVCLSAGPSPVRKH